MTQARIRAALETKLKTWADAQTPPVFVAWENVEATQPDALHLRSFVLPADTDSADLGRVNRRYAGVYQVSVVAPFNGGPGAAVAVVDALAALFDPAAPLSGGGLTVWLAGPMSAAPGIQERDRWVVPCSVSYLADTY